ncbi:hypothetical protein I551_6242 [Mycobacterium ulcerans str. Harvey]|uniref:Uncharacterized protein n=1 Tax=Mycobacterium ulcerans str. Harvey TaxID=1299332 RepID=A0ABN0QRN2_MYCUL|nr:hypothetical protein I551_6242 [Mycobacterium ulcerans str. Harvey]
MLGLATMTTVMSKPIMNQPTINAQRAYEGFRESAGLPRRADVVDLARRTALDN